MGYFHFFNHYSLKTCKQYFFWLNSHDEAYIYRSKYKIIYKKNKKYHIIDKLIVISIECGLTFDRNTITTRASHDREGTNI